MLDLPEPAAVTAKAVELGLMREGDRIPEPVRRQVIQQLLEIQAAPEPKAEAKGLLLSRSEVAVADGRLVIEVTHYAN